MEKKSIVIITARGGSKRIPRKNIRPFCGKPIIAYSIEAALLAQCFDEVMVSTDDTEIAEIAKHYGAQVPFYRSVAASDDHATSADVIIEVLSEYQKLGKEFDYACCLYPTAPFVTAQKLRESVTILHDKSADSVFPVVRFSYPIQRALKIENELVVMMWPENLNKRSQDLPPAYHDAGQFYGVNVQSFLEQKKLFMNKSLPIITNEIDVQDIDTEEDWAMAEIKYKITHPSLN